MFKKLSILVALIFFTNVPDVLAKGSRSGSSYRSGSSRSSASRKGGYVRGYTRKDGTYVSGHYRGGSASTGYSGNSRSAPFATSSSSPTSTSTSSGPRTELPNTSLIAVDGDTFYYSGQRYRIVGIDTPEIGEPNYELAKARLAQLLKSGNVTMQQVGVDVYGRPLVRLFANGQDVAEILKREGLQKPKNYRKGRSKSTTIFSNPSGTQLMVSSSFGNPTTSNRDCDFPLQTQLTSNSTLQAEEFATESSYYTMVHTPDLNVFIGSSKLTISAGYGVGGETVQAPSEVIVTLTQLHEGIEWRSEEKIYFRFDSNRVVVLPVSVVADEAEGGWLETATIAIPSETFTKISQVSNLHFQLGQTQGIIEESNLKTLQLLIASYTK